MFHVFCDFSITLLSSFLCSLKFLLFSATIFKLLLFKDKSIHQCMMRVKLCVSKIRSNLNKLSDVGTVLKEHVTAVKL